MIYVQKRFRDAKDAGLAPPCNESWESVESWFYDFDYASGIWFIDGDNSRFVASDGGEPEDQTLDRDWSWVVNELNKALDQH